MDTLPELVFGRPQQLVGPGLARSMGEGWETRRRRGDGNDWVELSLAGPGTVAVVPAMAPHAIRNAGDTTARVIGFFPEPTVTATFVEPILPLGQGTLVFGDAAEAPAAD